MIINLDATAIGLCVSLIGGVILGISIYVWENKIWRNKDI